LRCCRCRAPARPRYRLAGPA